MSETTPAPALADFLDALGRRVTLTDTRARTAVILTRTVDQGLNGGHPCLNRENARELGRALLEWADGGET